MNVGDRLGGYVLTQPFSSAGGGQSESAFAEKSGVSYFIKRFLKPTYPVDGGPGSERTRAPRLERCLRFEEHHQTVQQLLKPLSAPGGNLVVTRDFFRHGAHYFKVTERIDKVDLPVNLMASLPPVVVLGLMVEVASSLRILHRHGLVHGDLKPDNILLAANGAEAAPSRAKLIDFDNCFRTGDPPPPDDMVGDPAFYSPEMMAYLTGGAAKSEMTVSSDIFALALVFCHFLTGRPPSCKHPGYLAEGVLRGASVELPPLSAPVAPISSLLASMCARDPASRPDTDQVWAELKKLRRNVASDPAGTSTGTPGLRGSLTTRTRDSKKP